MIYISEFGSLIFRSASIPFEQEKEFLQQFSLTDKIVVRYSADEEIVCSIKNTSTGSEPLWSFSYDGGKYAIEIEQLDEYGEYEITLSNELGITYARTRFLVVDDKCLEDTVKISFTHRRNEFNALFIRPRSKTNIVCDIRFKGGFIPKENTYEADDEYFRDQNYVGHLTSSFPYFKQKLTIGDGFGVPEWVGLKLNAIFSLSDVKINDAPYKRSDGAVPERVDLGDYYPFSVWKLDVEPDDFYGYGIGDIEIPDTALYSNAGEILTDNTEQILEYNYGNQSK